MSQVDRMACMAVTVVVVRVWKTMGGITCLSISREAGNFRNSLEGLQHKYAQTVLLLSSNQCAMYCRHCFRKQMVGLTEDELNRRVDEAVEYVKNHDSIMEYMICPKRDKCLGNDCYNDLCGQCRHGK